MRGNVKRKYFSLELKWAEDVVHPKGSPLVAPRSGTIDVPQ
jgi:hypothetical protein